MACKDVKEFIQEYENITNEVQEVCTDRACTPGAILKALENKGTILEENTLLAVLDQIKGMMHFDKMPKYDIGDDIEYESGMLFKSKKKCNLLVEITYERYYLYNPQRHIDYAFREHMLSRIEFDIHDQIAIKCGNDLQKALTSLNIPKDKWQDYAFLVGDDVHCISKGHGTCIYMGKLVKL